MEKRKRGRPHGSYELGIPMKEHKKQQKALQKLHRIELERERESIETLRLRTSVSKKDIERINKFCKLRGWTQTIFLKMAVQNQIAKLVEEEYKFNTLLAPKR